MQKTSRSFWIINQTQDSLWIIGSVSFSYIFLLLFYSLNYYVGLSIASLAVYAIWAIIFDGTHVFATYTRTYFDKQFRAKNTFLIYGSLTLLLVGPLYMTLFYLLGNKQHYRAAFLVFDRFGILFAYYHIIRQHWGFISLYDRKQEKHNILQSYLEYILLWSGAIYPFIYYYIYHYVPVARFEKLADSIEGQDWLFISTVFLYIFVFISCFNLFIVFNNRILSKNIKILKGIFFALGGLFLLASLSIKTFLYFGAQETLTILLYLTKTIFITSLLLYISYVIYNKLNFNYLKVLILLAVLCTHNIILSLPISYIVVYACLTVFHNIQYHCIVRFHNVNKYSSKERQYGWATKLTRNLLLFAILALGFNLFSTVPRATLNLINVDEFFIYLAASSLWGIAFHHYIFDSIIWRPSQSTDLSANLNLNTFKS